MDVQCFVTQASPVSAGCFVGRSLEGQTQAHLLGGQTVISLRAWFPIANAGLLPDACCFPLQNNRSRCLLQDQETGHCGQSTLHLISVLKQEEVNGQALPLWQEHRTPISNLLLLPRSRHRSDLPLVRTRVPSTKSPSRNLFSL